MITSPVQHTLLIDGAQVFLLPVCLVIVVVVVATFLHYHRQQPRIQPTTSIHCAPLQRYFPTESLQNGGAKSTKPFPASILLVEWDTSAIVRWPSAATAEPRCIKHAGHVWGDTRVSNISLSSVDAGHARVVCADN